MEDLTTKALECLEDIYRNAVFTKKEYVDTYTTHHKLFGESPETHKTISEQCTTIKQALIQAEQDKIIADFVRKHYVVGTDINDDFLKLVKPFTQEESEKVEDIINGK